MDGTVDGVFPVAAEAGGDGGLAVGEVIGDDAEVAGDGRVIRGSLVCQDRGQDIGVMDGDDERDGAVSPGAAPISCLSTPLQTVDGSASWFGRHQSRNLPCLVE
jgi:hypothetical protein